MPINLLNDKDFNDYLIDITYQGGTVPKQPNFKGEFESPDYVFQHRDEIIKGILNQYIKSRLREYVVNLENEPAFVLVDKNRPDLPGWTQTVFARGDKVYQFDGTKMSQQLIDDITMVRDFLYEEAGMYVDKVIARARQTEQKPKIRYDYLKSNGEYNTFQDALDAAKSWHENIAQNLENRERGRDFFEKSLKGAKHVMDLSDGFSVYELTTPAALDFESEYMGHCVGQGSYDAGVKNGSIKIYSIRGANGEPHVTLEVRGNDVYQCKGKANKQPAKKHVLRARKFVQKQKLNIKNDKKYFGYITIDDKEYDLYNLPEKLEVHGDLDLRESGLTELPDISKWIVHGNFYCSENQLTSLNGAPQNVGGGFDCSYNQLTSLEHAPQSVVGDFYCSYNQLTSLEHAPQSVGGGFYCSNNQLTSLEHAPQSVGGGFYCSHNQLTSLEHAPQSVGGGFYCSNNKLTSLEHAPKHIGGYFGYSNNPISDSEYASAFRAGTNKIKSKMMPQKPIIENGRNE